MRTPLKYLLIPLISASLHASAVPGSLSGDSLNLDFDQAATLKDFFSFEVEPYWLADGQCFSLAHVPCLVSKNYSPLFERDGELYLMSSGNWFAVQHLYSKSLDTGDITTYYFDENLVAVTEVPLPNIGLILFSMTSMFIATMSRSRSTTEKSH
jgi:hypothetical protein